MQFFIWKRLRTRPKDDAASEYRATGICLRFQIDNSVIPCILDIPFSHLCMQPVSYFKVAARKYRFIDAKSFAEGHGLRVLEFNALPKKRYCKLSYVGRGSSDEGEQQIMQSSELGTLNVDGVLNADPISIDVLVTVCICVLARKCELLWIDGICIIQNDENDKIWQIQRNVQDLQALYAVHHSTRWTFAPCTTHCRPPGCIEHGPYKKLLCLTMLCVSFLGPMEIGTFKRTSGCLSVSLNPVARPLAT
jgi:hypothetical protein